MKKGKKITINILAEMLNRAFASVDARFDKIDGRFAAMDIRFDRLEAKFDKMEQTVNINHENRISRLEDSTRVIRTKLDLA